MWARLPTAVAASVCVKVPVGGILLVTAGIVTCEKGPSG
jgi:hypothetical protein